MSRPPSSRPPVTAGTSPAPPSGPAAGNTGNVGNANNAAAAASGPTKPAGPSVNTAVIQLDEGHGRILCVADVRGKLSTLNDLAREHGAHAILHTGDFGFFESASLDRISDRTLRHLTQYSPLIPGPQRTHLLAPDNPASLIRQTVSVNLLSEFPLLLSGQLRLDVPVFALWGACEDVRVLEQFRAGSYVIPNLTVLDEATTRALDVGGVRLRLLGLGGALVPHKLFDNGEGTATIAGAGGTMWTTALQIGELVDTAQRVYDPSETRLLLSHASPGREGLLAQLALALKADLTVSAGLHFRYATSYNEFSVQPDFAGFRRKLANSRDAFHKVWEAVRGQVDGAVDGPQRALLDKFLAVAERVPPLPGSSGPSGAPGAPTGPTTSASGASSLVGEEPAWKNCWHWNLCDAAYGALVLDIRDGRVSAELKSQGFNFAYRKSAGAAGGQEGERASSTAPGGQAQGQAPSKAQTPAPGGGAGAGTRPGSTQGHQGQGFGQNQNHGQLVSNRGTPAPRGHTPGAASVTSVGTGSGFGNANGSSIAPSSNAPSPAPGSTGNGGGGGGKTEEERAREKAEKFKAKKERLKEKRAEQKAEQRAKRVGASEGGDDAPALTVSTTSAAAATTSEPAKENDASGAAETPATDGASTGTGTPTSKRSTRNPWTLFLRIPAGTSTSTPEGTSTPGGGGADEPAIRAFFGATAGGIVRVNYPSSFAGREKRVAYVEFGDEEAMMAGLAGHAEKIGDATPEVSIARERPEREGSGFGEGGRGGFGGPNGPGGGGPGGRGRGGRGRGGGGGGGFAARGFAAAGLTRGGPRGGGPGGPGGSTNGGAGA